MPPNKKRKHTNIIPQASLLIEEGWNVIENIEQPEIEFSTFKRKRNGTTLNDLFYEFIPKEAWQILVTVSNRNLIKLTKDYKKPTNVEEVKP